MTAPKREVVVGSRWQRMGDRKSWVVLTLRPLGDGSTLATLGTRWTSDRLEVLVSEIKRGHRWRPVEESGK